MKIYDITPPLFSSEPYPGDIAPTLERVCAINEYNEFNISNITMCLHNGCHIDSPFHCLDDGASVDRLAPEKFIGKCTVASADGPITAAWIEKNMPWDCKRLIINTHKSGYLMENAVFEITRFNMELVGIDMPSVASIESDGAVHRELLMNNIAVLEGLDLDGVSDGEYFLVCPPLKIDSAEASPCRALLIKGIEL